MKKKIIFLAVVNLALAGLIILSSVLNGTAFKENYTQSIANSYAIVSKGVVQKLEYSLRYGKTLDNFYGIEDFFSEIKSLLPPVEEVFVADENGSVLYYRYFNESRPDTPPAPVPEDVLPHGGENVLWITENTQYLLLPIAGEKGETAGSLGLSYPLDKLNEALSGYEKELYRSTLFPALFGVLVFTALFLTIRHEYRYKRLIALVIPVVLASNVLFGIGSYSVYKKGYEALVGETAQTFSLKIREDIGSVVGRGVPYEELEGLDDYFSDILAGTNQLESLQLTEKQGEADDKYLRVFELIEDSTGKKRVLEIRISGDYMTEKLRGFVVEIAATLITSLLIAAEVIIFLLSVLTASKELSALRKKGTLVKREDVSLLPLGIVRGLFFFFAMFQYMSMAFVPLVMAEIYRPVLGLPYELVMGLPIAIQIFMSVFSAWFISRLVDKKGWRPAALGGMSLMAAGTVLAAMSSEPLLFILAQMVMGLGLGCAKTAFDIFGVLAPSSQSLEEYTSSTNAGLIVGMSCSAAIGAVIAGVVGYSGAFLVMGGFGLFVGVLIVFFSVNIVDAGQSKNVAGENGPHGEGGQGRELDASVQEAMETTAASREDEPGASGSTLEKPSAIKGREALRFASYLLLLVIPYFFISMVLDYYFPIYGDKEGMSTASIGHVFLLYGVVTSYLGAFLCRFLSRKIPTAVLMSGILLLLGAFLGLSALWGGLYPAIGLVLFIAVADGIMPSLQYRFVLSLELAGRLGISRVIGLEGAFAGMVRGASSFIFGLAMLHGSTGLFLAGVLVMAAALLFGFVNYRRKGGKAP